MGLKTTRLISFLRRVVVISTPSHALPQRAYTRAIRDRPPARSPPLSSVFFHTHTRKRRVRASTCLYVCIRGVYAHARARKTAEKRTYIKCVYVLDGMRASREAPKHACHLNKCLISPTSCRTPPLPSLHPG